MYNSDNETRHTRRPSLLPRRVPKALSVHEAVEIPLVLSQTAIWAHCGLSVADAESQGNCEVSTGVLGKSDGDAASHARLASP